MNDASTNHHQHLAGPEVDENFAPAQQPAPGRRLAQRRHELGWTIEHVAARLNLAPRQIEAIEADNYSALPGMATTRGFVRAYAKLLAIDATPLVSSMAAESTPLEDSIPLRRPLPAAPFMPARLEPARRGSSTVFWVLVVVALVLAGGFAAQRSGLLAPLADGVALRLDTRVSNTLPLPGNTEPVEATSAPAGQGEQATVPATPAPETSALQPAGPAIENTAHPTESTPAAEAPAFADAGKVAPGVAAVSSAPASTATTAAAEAASGSVPAESAAPTVLAATTTVIGTSSASSSSTQRLLVLKTVEDCWVEIRRPDNSSLLSRTLPAGSTEQITLSGPVTVVLGNASGVEAVLGGQPIDIAARARNNVARLQLK